MTIDLYFWWKRANLRSAGFTFIEIVVVILVLSILCAVGVPKFIDLQSKASADKCQQHRAMLAQVLHDRSTLEVTGAMKLNMSSSFSTSVNAAVNEIMMELGGGDSSCRIGSHCDELCPTEGAYYKVSYTRTSNDFLKFYVTCQVHGGEVGGDTQIGSQSNAMDFMNWLTGTGKGNNNYEKALWENGKSLDNFFTKNPTKSIDSEAMTLSDCGEEYANLPVLINQALAKSGLDMQDVVWRLSRDQLGVIDGMWNSRLVLVMADKSAPVGADGKVTTTVIKTEILYVPGTGNPVESFANIRQSSGKATLVKDPATGIVKLVPDSAS